MGIFSRNRTDAEVSKLVLDHAVQVNKVDTSQVVRPFSFEFFKRKGREDFADAILFSVTDKIFKGLKNITWTSTEPDITASEILHFIDLNAPTLVWHYWRDGFIAVMLDKDGSPRLPKPNEIKFDEYRRVVNKNAVVAYSEPYVMNRATHLRMINPLLKHINSLMNNSAYITESTGLYGILSGKGIPISPAAKDELQERMKKEYGMTKDDYNFMLANTEITYTPIEIPVKDLELYEKLREDISMLCIFFGMNPQYIYGDSTFANQEEANRQFYNDVIKPLAEILLSIARSIFIRNDRNLLPGRTLTYNLSNIPGMNTTLSAMCAEKKAYLDYLLALRQAGVDVSARLSELSEDSMGMLGNV